MKHSLSPRENGWSQRKWRKILLKIAIAVSKDHHQNKMEHKTLHSSLNLAMQINQKTTQVKLRRPDSGIELS